VRFEGDDEFEDVKNPIRYFEYKHLPGDCVRIGLKTSPTFNPKLAAE
jgi:hypothetical protein